MSIVILKGSLFDMFYFYWVVELEETLRLRVVSMKEDGYMTLVSTAFWNFSRFYFSFLFYSSSL